MKNNCVISIIHQIKTCIQTYDFMFTFDYLLIVIIIESMDHDFSLVTLMSNYHASDFYFELFLNYTFKSKGEKL